MAGLTVRPMDVDDLDVRARYFQEASDEHLALLGVDRARLSTLAEWRAEFEADLQRPIEQRRNHGLIWEEDGRTIGFSTADRIEFGEQAWMHLHVLDPTDRAAGKGTELVRLSVASYVDTFRLQRLFCEPNALNTAPNRTLQRAGFTYVLTHRTTPGPMNTEQVTNLWQFVTSRATTT